MKAKLVSALGLALVAVLLVAAVASADQGGGTGTLTAKGNGLVVLRGNISVTLSGAGILVIRDRVGDAQIQVTGRGFKKELKNGIAAYIGFDGQAQISGSAVDIALRGRNIELEATGTGHFLLRGHGSYHTIKDDDAWTTEGKVAALP